jgi:hypothetical protein
MHRPYNVHLRHVITVVSAISDCIKVGAWEGADQSCTPVRVDFDKNTSEGYPVPLTLFSLSMSSKRAE